MMIMINKTMIYLFRCSLVSCAVFKLFELQKYPRKKVLNNNLVQYINAAEEKFINTK